MTFEVKFSKKLVDEATEYLTKKTGEKPDKGLTEEFLMTVAQLGELLLKNARKILKES